MISATKKLLPESIRPSYDSLMSYSIGAAHVCSVYNAPTSSTFGYLFGLYHFLFGAIIMNQDGGPSNKTVAVRMRSVVSRNGTERENFLEQFTLAVYSRLSMLSNIMGLFGEVNGAYIAGYPDQRLADFEEYNSFAPNALHSYTEITYFGGKLTDYFKTSFGHVVVDVEKNN
jgi:hypothetical protein